MEKSLAELRDKYSSLIVTYDEYQIKKKKGTGGFGDVYSAIHISSKSKVIIKLFSTSRQQDLIQKSFCNEVSILADCEHPFIPKLIGFSVRSPYLIVLPEMKSGSLFDLLHKKEGFSFSGTQKTFIALGISSALKYLHSKNIVHRDINSANIVFNLKYYPYLIDYGISCRNGDIDSFSAFGSPEWMAPEIIKPNSCFTKKVDVYSFGLILWSLFTGMYPFNGKSMYQVMIDVHHHYNRPKIPSDMPHPLKKLIRSCWNHDPDLRPSFDMIYSRFSNGWIQFPDTNRDSIVLLMNENRLIVDSSPYQRLKKKGYQVDYSSKAPLDLSIISDTNSTFFIKNISIILAQISPNNAAMFFTHIKALLNKWCSEDVLSSIYEACSALLSDDEKSYINEFIKNDIHQLLRIENSPLGEASLDVLIHVFFKRPNTFDSKFLKKVFSVYNTYPAKVIRIINIYTCTDPIPKYFNDAAEFLISTLPSFIEGGHGSLALSLVFTIFSYNEEFKKKTMGSFFEVLISIIKGKDIPSIKAAYLFLTAENQTAIKLDLEMLINHIKIPDLQDIIIMLLIRNEQIPLNKELVSILLGLSTSSLFASSCLCSRSKQLDVARIVSSYGASWISHPLPSKEASTSLFMQVLKHPENRKITSSLYQQLAAQLLSMVCTDLVQYIYPILLNISITPQLIIELAQIGFFPKYFNEIKESQSGKTVCGALHAFELFSKTLFRKEMLSVFPLIETLIASANEKWATYVLSTLAIIVCSRDGIIEMNNRQMYQRIKFLGRQSAAPLFEIIERKLTEFKN